MIPLNFAPRCLIIARVLRMMNFLLPIMVLFYQDKGATVGDVFLIQGAWAISVFFLEIPSGYLGDLCSRKTMVALSFLVSIISAAASHANKEPSEMTRCAFSF